MTGTIGPLSYCELAEFYPSITEIYVCFVLKYEVYKRSLDNLFMWVVHTMDELGDNDLQCLILSVIALFVESEISISGILAEQNSANQGGNILPPVLPHQLIIFDMSSL